jgi:hypothetical protein
MENTKPLYCNKGHRMETKTTAAGTEARYSECEIQFRHISGLLKEGLATWEAPKPAGTGDRMSDAMIAAQQGPRPWG